MCLQGCPRYGWVYVAVGAGEGAALNQLQTAPPTHLLVVARRQQEHLGLLAAY